MLYLLDKDVKTVKWNGIPLHETSSAIVKEETNGDFTLTIRYPITDSGIYQLIKEDMLIKAPTPVLGPQLFRIKKPVENDDSLDITAYHITDDVMQRSIRPVSVVAQGCAMALSQMVQNAKTDLGTFSFTSDIMDSRTFNTTDAETLYSVLLDGKHSIVGTWEGELVRDNFALSVKRSRGTDRGVVITTHKNLKSYQRTKNSQSVVTRIHAKSTFKPEGAEDEVTLRVTVDSPLIGNYPYINEKDYENNNAKTVDELRKWAEAKFKNEGIDKISDAIEIEAYELDGQVIHLGDTVNIKSRKHDVDIYKKAIAYEYNALTEEYISITFDDKPGVGGSGVSSGVSNAADVILGVNANAQEIAVERAIRNANQAFDAEFDKRVESINDGIEQAKADAERYADAIKQEIDTEIAQVNQSMQAQSEEHDRQVADILSKTQSVESLANQAKSDAASALARANQAKTEAIADARAQVATVNQALNTAKSELQSAIASADQKARDSQASATALRNDLNLQASKILAQAQAQTALTSRVTTVETLADGTKTTVAELSKTVNNATGDIASVTSRTKTVEDTLSQTRTQYEALTQSVNAQTGQIDSINRRTGTIEVGLTGIQERFESIKIGNRNYFKNAKDRSYLITNAVTQDFRTYIYEDFWKNTLRFERNKVRVSFDIAFSPALPQNFTTKVHFAATPWYSSSVTFKGNTTDVQHIDLIIDLSSSNASYWADNVFIRFSNSFPVNTNVSIKNMMLYISDFKEDYAEPSEDFRSEFATYVRNATENSAELVRRIETADGKAVDAKSYAQQTAEGFKSRIESLETYKDAEGTRASQYLTASRTETAKQIAAERTAIATDYVAKSTYTEDVRGTTQKLNEIKNTADTAKQNLATYQNTVDRKLEELTSSTQTLDGKIDTASTKVDTVASQIRTEISEVEGKIPTDFDGLNLMTGTRDWSTKANPWHMGTGWVIEQNEHEGLKVHSTQRGWNGSHQNIFVKTGDVVTFSFFAKATQSLNNVKVSATWTDSSVYQAPVARIAESDDVITISDSWKRYSKTVHVLSNGSLQFRTEYNGSTIPNGNKLYIAGLKLAKSSVDTGYSENPTDLMTEIASVKTTITQTASGVEQLSTSLSTTNDKVTTAEAEIRNLVDEVSSKVSQTDYNTLTGRVDSAETAITQNATEISKRLTSTQVESFVVEKGYATSTVVQNLVKETSDAFKKSISETKKLIPTNFDNTNLLSVSNLKNGWFDNEGILRLTTMYVSTDYIELDSNTSYIWQTWTKSSNWAGLVLFDSQKQYITGSYRSVTVDSYVKQTIESGNAKYIVFSFDKSILDGAIKSKLEKGSIATEWVPAYQDLVSTTEFHEVADTVDSHKRTISEQGKSISQVIQTANGLVTKVSALDKSDNLFSFEKSTKGFWIDRNGSAIAGKTYSHSDFLKLASDGTYQLQVWNKSTDKKWIGYTKYTSDKSYISGSYSSFEIESNGYKLLSFTNFDGYLIISYGSYTTDNMTGLEIQFERGLVATAYKLSTLDFATQTQVNTLAGSWSVQNLNSSGDILSQANLSSAQFLLEAAKIRLKGKTLADEIKAIDGKFGTLFVADGTFSKLKSTVISAKTITGEHILFDKAFFDKMLADEALFKTIYSKNAFLTAVQAVTLSASKIQGGVLEAVNSAMKMDLNNANITFNQNATINFNSANNALVRRKGTHTAFVHFNDVMSSSDGGVGSLYASIGVTSSGDGIDSESSGRFAGLRAFRGARGLTHNATLDQLELYGDRVLLMDDFDLNRGFMFRPAALSRDDFIDMNQLVTCVRALRDMWAHYKNSNGTLSDLLNNRSNSSVNASWENMHSFK